MLMKVFDDWFLYVVDCVLVCFWVGCWLMMFDGLLLFGVSGIDGFWFNVGYGLMGWVMLMGLGKVVVDFVIGCVLEIDLVGLMFVCYDC